MNIAFFEIEDWEKGYFQNKFPNDMLYFSNEPISQANLANFPNIDILSPFIYSLLNKEIIDQIPTLKLIATRSTGTDHIDCDYCKIKNISVLNVPVYGTNTVAEHTFALILAISRNLIPSVERTKRGDFSLSNLRGFELYGKTIGVIGAGNIGSAVIKIAHGFGMKILAYSRHQIDESLKALGVKQEKLYELFKNSDIVSLHIPYNKETHHFINKTNIDKFKQGSLLINTSRGGVVETEAILYGLDKGILKGVGLDVLEEECYIKEERQLITEEFLKECNIKTQLLNHILLTKENVIITPHNAFNSKEALQRILDVTAENIQTFISKTSFTKHPAITL